jgi:integrative and conjugative element protein (TIGR02256 family)
MRFFEHPVLPFFFAICDEALAVFRTYEQHGAEDTEAGGVLIGEERDRGLTITVATPPQTTDRRSRYRFHRREAGHQQLVEAAWRQSGGCQSYIGEWHSHPELHPFPSFVDRIGWSARSVCAAKPLAVIVVGQHGLYVGLQDRISLVRLEETRA